ncbi:MAG: response regulator [Oscillospiraceae bacterium]|nr:response regulator [Oscillospiraceae bacterium]
MAGRVLLINRGTAFLTNALVTSLKNAGISTAQVGPEVEQISRFEKGADVFLYFAGNDEYPPTKLLQYLKTVCADSNKHLCVLGYSKDLNEIGEIIPKSSISREFLRPIDVKTLTEEISSLLRSEAEKKEEKRILLVDDDVTFLRIMQGWLSERYTITAVKSGMQAITFIATHTPDLILLDYDMPVTSGPQVLEMIRSEPSSKNIPVIFLTGKNDRASVLNAMSLKADGYLLKTSGKESILESVNDFLTAPPTEKNE